MDEMQVACKRAQEIPAQENNFRRLYLNQWTEQASRWLSVAAWDACQGTTQRASLKGRKCYVGMDLSTTKDLTAVAAVFPDEASGRFDVLMQFFVPKDSIRERSLRDHVPYDEWARHGQITATDGNRVDYEMVRQAINAWAKEFSLQMIALDTWNATDLIERLTKLDGFTLVGIRQTFAGLSAPTKALEHAVLSKTLRHTGDPVLRWNVSNVAVETDPVGNLKPSKVKSTERIDGVVALIMAVDLMQRQAATVTPSYQMLVVG